MIVPNSINAILASYDYNRKSIPKLKTRDNQETRQCPWRRKPQFVRDPHDREIGHPEMSSVCEFCGHEIFWKKSKSGKWYAVDQEESNTAFHSETCDGRERVVESV